MRVEVERGDAVVLVPRLSGGVLRFEGRPPGPARRPGAAGRSADPALEAAQGLVAGPALLSLSRDGALVGAEVLEEQRWWRPQPVGWELRTRAHVLRVVREEPGDLPEPRWDASRRLFWLGWDAGAAAAPRIVGLGPRAYAAVAGDRLVALLADLRGFGR